MLGTERIHGHPISNGQGENSGPGRPRTKVSRKSEAHRGFGLAPERLRGGGQAGQAENCLAAKTLSAGLVYELVHTRAEHDDLGGTLD